MFYVICLHSEHDEWAVRLYVQRCAKMWGNARQPFT